MRFFELTYSRNHVCITEWLRSGECQGKKCGHCCSRKIQFTTCEPLHNNDTMDGGESTDGRGVWCAAVEERDGETEKWLFGHVKVGGPREETCCDFEDGLCKAHGRKHKICELWPLGPGQLLPGCGYSFTKGESEKLS